MFRRRRGTSVSASPTSGLERVDRDRFRRRPGRRDQPQKEDHSLPDVTRGTVLGLATFLNQFSIRAS